MTQQTNKRNLMLLGLLALLGLAALLLSDPFGWRKQRETEEQANDIEKIELIGGAADTLSSIEIDPPDAEAFSLVKENDSWFAVQGVKRYRANMDKVTPILEQLPGTRSEAIATSKSEKYEELELTPEKAYRIKVYTGAATPSADLLIGKAAEGYKACFARINGEKEPGKDVYRSGTNIRALIAFAFDDYRTRKPWTFDPLLAEELRIKRPPVQQKLPPKGEGQPEELKKDANGFSMETQAPEALVFTKKDGVWKLPDGRNGNQNMIKDLLQKITEVQINEYAEDKTEAETGLSASLSPSIEIQTPGEKFTVTIAPEKADNRFLKDQDGRVYRLSSYGLRAYLEDLKFDELTFDDTKVEEAKDGDAQAADDSGADKEDDKAADSATTDAESSGK